ncbi:U4/U6 snRNP-associated protein [Babesia caballi]|uniref:U4/U6 snRNP-associated protein n=1 Tax=Babesia caballi TaxID=5871 RepID=A0AAV4LVQ0_BABCB|nr:U4/U6 snRNP-associated protein [Babesia caballi]
MQGSLVDSFLDDLDDLERQADEEAGTAALPSAPRPDLFESDDEAPIVDAVAEYFDATGLSSKVFSTKVKDPQLIALVERVKVLAQQPAVDTGELSLIDQCNQAVLEIDLEIINVFNHVRDIYSKRFPKLEAIVTSPLDYMLVVKRAQNEIDFTKVRLFDLLPNAMIMAITVAATSASGSPLSAPSMNEILVYLESRMVLLAPNVSAIIGSALAARLINQAGGLGTLAKMPAQNIMLVGGNRKGVIVPGIIHACDIIQNAEPAVRHRAVKLVSGKLSLAARVDLFKESRDGSVGTEYRNYIVKELHKVGQAQEPPPAPTKKSLPVPDERKATKRGGRRLRKAKERLATSEFRKYANRLKFGEEAEDEYGLESGGLQLVSCTPAAAQRPLGIELCNPESEKPAQKRKSSILDNSGGFFKVGKR